MPLMDARSLETFGLPAVEARVAGRTHPGQRRSENQDNFLISDLSAVDPQLILRPDAGGMPDDAAIRVGPRGVLLVVADGMGGAAAGRLASGLACTFILAEIQESWLTDRDTTPRRFASRLREAVVSANARIHLHANRNPETVGMGSTVTAAGVLDGMLYLAQVGDSRAYLTRGGVATQITRDQSLVQNMIDAGALSPEEAEHSAHGNVILQALGVKPAVDVDVTFQALCRDDVLVLCSDGLHRVVRPEEVAGTIGRVADPAGICSELVDLANQRGGPDNVTVVAARFAGIGLTEPRSTDTVGRSAWTDADTDAVQGP
jgi:PPM family protein phosphatase